MPDRPADPRTYAPAQNDVLRRLRELEREVLRLPEGTDPLQTYENGKPLGDTRFLDFGPGIQSTLIGSDFVRISADAGEMVFDALVDAAQTTNESERIFAGIGEALTYLAVTVGLTHAAVAVRNGAYTEAANWSTPSSVRLFVLRGMERSSAGQISVTTGTRWEWNGFGPTVESDLHVDDMAINAGTRPGIKPFDTLTAENCYFSTLTTTPTTAFCTFFNGVNCSFDFVNDSGTITWASSKAVFMGCDIVFRNSGTTSPTYVLASSHLFITASRLGVSGSSSGGTVLTLSLPANFYIHAMNSADPIIGSASTVPRQMTVPSGAYGFIHMVPSTQGSTVNWDVVATSSFESLELIGAFFSITASGAHKALKIDAVTYNQNGTGTFDITGPATLVASGQDVPRYVLRGTGIAALLDVAGIIGSSGTIVSFVNADYCEVNASLDGTGTTGTMQPYAFDAASTNNVLLIAGRSTFPAAGTDAGTNNRVLPEGTTAFTTDGHVIEDEGTPLTQRTNLNFVGAGVTVTDSAPDTIVTIPGGAGHVIEDEGVPLPAQPNLNFVGAGVTVTDSASDTIVTISGGGGGGGDEPSAADWMGF